MKVDVRGARDDPESLGFRCRLEHAPRLCQESMTVVFTGHEHQRGPDLADPFDGSDQVGIDAKAGLNLQQEKWSKELSQGSEPDRDPVRHSLAKGGIDGFEDQGLDGQRCGAQEGCRASLGNSQVGDAVPRKLRAQEGDCRGGIQRFEVAEGDVPSRALAMGLGIEEKHGVAGPSEEIGSLDHLEAIRAHRMGENQCAAARHASDEPASNRAARLAGKTHVLSVEGTGRYSHRLRGRRGESRAKQPEPRDSSGRNGSQWENDELSSSPHLFVGAA